jgi:2-keto-3-deoxy-L-rhamnonate aldolase RhmA
VAFCAVAEGIDMPVQFRIQHTRHAYLIGRYLDLGATAIVVPEVREEATVDEAVRFFYYPQKGKRSWGGDARRGFGKRPDRLEYAAWWNAYGVLSIQLESLDAVINCRQLAKPGIDAVLFGPNDLAYDIESYHQPPLGTLDECVKHVVRELEGSGCRVALSAPFSADRQKYIDMGVTVF